MAKVILVDAELALSTRRKTPIPNRMTRTDPHDGEYNSQKDQEKSRRNAKRRFVGPSKTYDCHGLTFGARRTNVGGSIEDILHEDDYTEIEKKNVMPGDIVIYWSTPDPLKGISKYITHSGIVLGALPLGDLQILSKWGHGDEWVHNLADCPYSAANVKFHRINDDPRAKRG